jgi:hypothetical protein
LSRRNITCPTVSCRIRFASSKSTIWTGIAP